MSRKRAWDVLDAGGRATRSGSAGGGLCSSGASSLATTASSRAWALSQAARAETPGSGRTGVTMKISSRTVSKTIISVGRIITASGTPIGSDFAAASVSI